MVVQKVPGKSSLEHNRGLSSVKEENTNSVVELHKVLQEKSGEDGVRR